MQELALLAGGGPALAATEPEGLLEALAQVPNPRDRRGIRYPLVPVLAIAVCAMLTGARSYAAIAEWAADAPPRPARQAGPARPGPGPGDDLAGADRGGPGGVPHLLACLDHGAGVVLAQIAVDRKTNEITMFTALLSQPGDLTGVLVTADALHAQREHATRMHERGAHYLVTVKGNRPGLLRQLRSLPWKDVPAGHAQDGRGHGRIEKRIIKVVTVAAGLAFPHAAQAIQVTRKTRRPGSRKWRTETSYAVTSLPSGQVRPGQLARWIRGHWTIENQLHWVRDVTFGEDASTARTGTGPHVMATLRNLVISILRLAGHASIAAALRHAARDPARAFRLLTGRK